MQMLNVNCSFTLFQVLESLPLLCSCLYSKWTAVRHMAARCVGMFARRKTLDTMNIALDTLLPWLGASHDQSKRQGAIEALASILTQRNCFEQSILSVYVLCGSLNIVIKI